MKTKIYAYLHTHWDREWYKSFQEFRLRLLEVFDVILAELCAGEIHQFTFDGQTIVLEDYLELRPEKRSLIEQLVQDQKIFVGPWYVLPDEFLVTGESLVRNLLIGHTLAESFGACSKIGYIPDTFGHCLDIPRILRGFDIDNAVIWRGVWQDKNVFKWQSLDGSAVLTAFLFKGYAQDHFYTTEGMESLVTSLSQFIADAGCYGLGDNLLLPVGGDHLAPPQGFSRLLEEVNRNLESYEIVECSLADYFNVVRCIAPSAFTLCKTEQLDNHNAYLLSGVWSTRLYLKQLNAHLSVLFKQCEEIAVMASLAKVVSYPDSALKYAWKLYVQNHAHDSICGCSTDQVHLDVENRFHNVSEILEALLKQNLYKISTSVSEGAIFIYNFLDHRYSGVVRLKTYHPLPSWIPHQIMGTEIGFPPDKLNEIRQVPFAEDLKYYTDYMIWVQDLPAHSFSFLDTPATSVPSSVLDVICSDLVIENGFLRVQVNDFGFLDVTDLKTGRVWVNLHQIIDVGDKGDSYNFGPVQGDKPVCARLEQVKKIHQGPLCGTLELTYLVTLPQELSKNRQKRSSQQVDMILKTTVSLLKGCHRVEFKTSFKNSAKDHKLQVCFPTGKDITQVMSHNHFSVIERTYDPSYSEYNAVPVEKLKECKTTTGPVEKFVSVNGLTLYPNGLSEYEVRKDAVALTLVRSVGWLSRGDIGSRGGFAGPPLETPDGQCLRVITAEYALSFPESTAEALMKQSQEYLYAPIARVGVGRETKCSVSSFVAWHDDRVVTTAFKQAEKGHGYILRLLNVSSEKFTLDVHWHKDVKGYCVCPLSEEVADDVMQKDEVPPLHFEPYQLVTLCIRMR